MIIALLALAPLAAGASVLTPRDNPSHWPELRYRITVTKRAGHDPIIHLRVLGKDAPRYTEQRRMVVAHAVAPRRAMQRRVRPVAQPLRVLARTAPLRLEMPVPYRWAPGAPEQWHGSPMASAIVPPRRARLRAAFA